MDIKLYIQDEEETFTVPFIKGRMFRRVLEINKKHDLKDIDPETLDILVDFVVECFNEQFSRDEFYDGIAAGKLIDTTLGIIEKVSGVAGKGTGKSDPNLKKG
jgi:hypothetical protein